MEGSPNKIGGPRGNLRLGDMVHYIMFLKISFLAIISGFKTFLELLSHGHFLQIGLQF